MQSIPRKPSLAILWFATLALAMEIVPSLHNYRFITWDALPGALDCCGRSANAQAEESRLKPGLELERTEPPRIENLHGLGSFYSDLLAVERGRSALSIAHYGDSPVTADMISSDVRRLLQARFGGRGDGFVLIAKPWAWYAHAGLDISGNGWSFAAASVAESGDGLFGLGGVSFVGRPGARSVIRPANSASQVEIATFRHPGGGKLLVSADDSRVAEIDTQGPESPQFTVVPLPAGPSRLTLEVASGHPRIFGVQLLSGESGIVYHSLGLNGASIGVLGLAFNEAHWAVQLRHYRPSLVVVNYGTNESAYASYIKDGYERDMRAAIWRIRRAIPGTSVLIMSPMDRGQRTASGVIGTSPALERLIALQQRIAASEGCAFFNTFQAMGGRGTMARWYAAQPRLVSSDFIHPLPNGARLVASVLFRSLMRGYEEFKIPARDKM